MTVEIYIDEDKKILIVGKPSFEYEVTHTEYYPERDVKKIWIKKLKEDHIPWTDPRRHP